MGITHFITIISLKGSDTYLFASLCRWHLHAITESGACDPAEQRHAWVRLVVAHLAAPEGAWQGSGDGLGPECHSPQSCFSKCRISRMIGVMRQMVEHSADSNVYRMNASL